MMFCIAFAPSRKMAPARAVAQELGIPVALHVAENAPAGVFTLDGDSGSAAKPGYAETSGTALVLHTSGTTSRRAGSGLSRDAPALPGVSGGTGKIQVPERRGAGPAQP